jgi:hypothetical protein
MDPLVANWSVCKRSVGGLIMAIRRSFLLVLILSIMGVGALCSPTFAQTFQEVRVRWDAYPTMPPEGVLEPQRFRAAALFAVVERRHASGAPPRQRALELSANQLLIVAVDRLGRDRQRLLLPDPRLVRAEWPDPTGQLQGVVLHRANAEFFLPVPDDPAISELRVYHPRWTGNAFDLDLLGTVRL